MSQTAAAPARKLPITRAALLVLQDAGGGPIHYQALTTQIVERQLVASASRKLERTVYSNLCTHIRDKGERSWFAHAGRGLYVLTSHGEAAAVWRSPVEDDGGVPSDPGPAFRNDLTWLDAAEIVLMDAGCPLHYREIITRVWAMGLKARLDARWPERTLANELARCIRTEGPTGNPRFVRTGAGRYGLVAWEQTRRGGGMYEVGHNP